MDEMEKQAELLRKKAEERITSEKPEETTDRIKKAFDKRDGALRKIRGYQDKTGIPDDSEADKHFIETETSIEYDKFKNAEEDNEV